MSRPITVVLVDDHAVTREGTRRILEEHGHFAVVAEVDRGDTAVAAIAAEQPDVVLLDLFLPGASGVEVARELRQRCPSTSVLVLSAFADPEYVDAMLDAGVAGYLPKTARPEQLADAVRAVASGSTVLGAGVAPSAPRRGGAAALPEPGPALGRPAWGGPGSGGPGSGGPALGGPVLTERERDVVELLVDGLTNQQIAERLRISRRTVETHLQHIFDKCDARSRTGVVLYALRHALVRHPAAEPGA
ncbi:MAG TPA: response regulator transcription factor [Acidimicrobiales bacterium]|nr:response regulator transcription factor [Acidimicrobiales bacterium]